MRLNASPINAVAVNATARGLRAVLLSAFVSAATTAKRSFSIASTATAAAAASVTRALHLLFATIAIAAAQNPDARRLYSMLVVAYAAAARSVSRSLSRVQSAGVLVLPQSLRRFWHLLSTAASAASSFNRATHVVLWGLAASQASLRRSLLRSMRVRVSVAGLLGRAVTKNTQAATTGTSSLRRSVLVQLSVAVTAAASLMRMAMKRTTHTISVSANAFKAFVRACTAQVQATAPLWATLVVTRAADLFNTLETTYIAARSRVSVMVARARTTSLRIRK